ncbi:MAG: serine protease, partial [Tannerellaceae bacterium]|nr:serine protease [Tannerellaceae bacterium]
MKKILLITLCGLFAYALHAQITTDERPYGLNVTAKARVNGLNVITLSTPNRTVIAQEDLINDSQPGPVRYAYPVDVNYTLENSGVWQELNDGSKIWRLKVKLPGALSTNTIYDKFWLPEGGKFFVYSEDTEQYIGAITSEYIEGSRENPIEFATAIIYGETVVFEYFQPASVSDSAVISIPRIYYGYRYVDNPYENILRDLGFAGSCNININCSEGNNWQTEKHAVTRIGIPGPNSFSWCSGALVNNTANNGTPYVLTAHHCLEGLDAISNSSASQWIFYWEYEHPGCANSATEPAIRSTTGATVVANNSISDFALLRLTQNPRNVSGVIPYYLGWDRSGNAGTSGVGIHHPMGDVKKISATNQIQNYSSQITWSDGTSSLANTHWKAIFYNGLIEGASSGSPLINNDHRLIGELSGGQSAVCNTNYYKYYGKFSVSWTGNGATDNRRKLQPWLDPAGTNPTTLNGVADPCQTLSHNDFSISAMSEGGNVYTLEATANVVGIDQYQWELTQGSGWTIIQHPFTESGKPYMYKVRVTKGAGGSSQAIVRGRPHNCAGWADEWIPIFLPLTSSYSMSASLGSGGTTLIVQIDTDSEAYEAAISQSGSGVSTGVTSQPVFTV